MSGTFLEFNFMDYWITCHLFPENARPAHPYLCLLRWRGQFVGVGGWTSACTLGLFCYCPFVLVLVFGVIFPCHLVFALRCIEVSWRLSESNVVVASSNRSAWEKSLKRLQSSFRLHCDRSLDRSGDVSGCKNIQRSRFLIIKLKCSFFVSAIVFLYIYI